VLSEQINEPFTLNSNNLTPTLSVDLALIVSDFLALTVDPATGQGIV